MNIQYNKINIKKLLEFGFIKNNNEYIYKCKLTADLTCVITIKQDELISDVYDDNTGDKFSQFYLKSNKTGLAAQITDEVETLIEKIIKECFETDNSKEEVIKYCEETYPTKVERPWKKWPSYVTLKAKNDKWYGIFLDCKYSQLDKNNKSNEVINVLNLKLEPTEIDNLINNKTIFRAYHMNKKNWISIVIDSNTNMELLKNLISKSYNLINK